MASTDFVLLSRAEHGVPVWIGLRIGPERDWEWVDETPLDYTAWGSIYNAYQQPMSTGPYAGNCVVLTDSYFMNWDWDDILCDKEMNYICQADIRK